MRIGEVADQIGLSTKALRYYERVGLIDPPDRTPSGYRDYANAVLDRLRFIRAAQAAGLSLGEIRGVIAFREQGNAPCAHVLDLVESRAADLDRRIAEMRSLRDDLRRLAQRGRGLSPETCSADLVCHILNPGSDGSSRAAIATEGPGARTAPIPARTLAPGQLLDKENCRDGV